MSQLPKERPRLALMASHQGSNLQALLDACNCGRLAALPIMVISNNADSGALEKARRAGLPALHISARTHPGAGAEDAAILAALLSYRADWIALAGYMKHVGPAVLNAYRNRVINVHPGPLPAYGGAGLYGQRVHEAVLAAGERRSAVCIHLVEEEYDRGQVLAVEPVPVLPQDTVQTLAQRVLQVEHRLYAETLQRVLHGEIPLSGSAAGSRQRRI